MKRTHLIAALTAFLLSAGIGHAANLTLPVTVAAGTARTSVVLGTAAGASDGYDKGLDVPPADLGENLTALIPHPDWTVVAPDGKGITSVSRDIRGSLPQQFAIQITAAAAPVILSWDRTKLPATITAALTLPDGRTIDMKQQASATLNATSGTVTVALDDTGDTIAPAQPQGLSFELKGTGFYLTWQPNREPDLAGYRLYWSKAGGFTRSVDLKNVTNYNLMDIASDVPYQIAVSAYDTAGNESEQTTLLTAVKATPAPAPVIVADGDIDGDGMVSIADAIKLLRITLKLDYTTIVALNHGDMDRDGALSVKDVVLVLKKSIGL